MWLLYLFFVSRFLCCVIFFFFQAEDGIRDKLVTGVQTCDLPIFAEHVPKLTRGLRAKLETLMEALAEQFGTSAEFDDPKGGIFLWVKLPDGVDTQKLAQAALAAGVAINPGRDWSTQEAYGKSRLRLCFANPS